METVLRLAAACVRTGDPGVALLLADALDEWGGKGADRLATAIRAWVHGGTMPPPGELAIMALLGEHDPWHPAGWWWTYECCGRRCLTCDARRALRGEPGFRDQLRPALERWPWLAAATG